MDKTSTIVEFRSMVENLPSSKKNMNVAKNLVDRAKESKNSVALSDPDFLRIMTALSEAINFFVSADNFADTAFVFAGKRLIHTVLHDVLKGM